MGYLLHPARGDLNGQRRNGDAKQGQVEEEGSLQDLQAKSGPVVASEALIVIVAADTETVPQQLPVDASLRQAGDDLVERVHVGTTLLEVEGHPEVAQVLADVDARAARPGREEKPESLSQRATICYTVYQF